MTNHIDAQTALGQLLESIDYTSGKCRANEMIAALVPEEEMRLLKSALASDTNISELELREAEEQKKDFYGGDAPHDLEYGEQPKAESGLPTAIEIEKLSVRENSPPSFQGGALWMRSQAEPIIAELKARLAEEKVEWDAQWRRATAVIDVHLADKGALKAENERLKADREKDAKILGDRMLEQSKELLELRLNGEKELRKFVQWIHSEHGGMFFQITGDDAVSMFLASRKERT